MHRRKFISVALWSSVGWAINPLSAAVTMDPWKAEKVKDAIAALYGNGVKLIASDKIKIVAPKLAENSSFIPIEITSEIAAKRVILLQNGNHYALTGIFEVPEDELVEYRVYIKLKQASELTVLIEDIYGAVYENHIEIDVSISEGCGE